MKRNKLKAMLVGAIALTTIIALLSLWVEDNELKPLKARTRI